MTASLNRWIIPSLLLLSLLSCRGGGEVAESLHPIPRWPVALQVSLYHEGRELLDPYTALLFGHPRYEGERLGHIGIVVVHTVDSKFAAYDLACPHCWPSRQAVKLLPDRLLQMTCTQCHTTYDLALGSGHPISGPGKYPLLSYQVTPHPNTLWVE